MDGERGVLVGAPEARRERDLRAERRRGASSGSAASIGVSNVPGRDRHDADAELREVARDRQRHADDAALGRRVGDLADLAVERGDRGGVDDDAALAVSRSGSLSSIAAAASRSTLNVPIRLIRMTFANTRARAARLAGGLRGPADARAADGDPQRASRGRSTAACTCRLR